MELIDEDGRLFGYVNVIDGLVVLLVLAVVIAGVTLVTQPDPPPPTTATRYATLDLGTHPAYLADQVNPGDSYEPAANTNLTITDVYATETDDGVHLLVRARLTAPVEGRTFTYNGGPPRLGRSVTIATPAYELSGPLVAVDTAGMHLRLTRVPVLLDANIPAEAANRIAAGDRVVTGNRTLATVSEVLRYDTESPNQRRVIVLTSLLLHRTRGGLEFGTRSFHIGQDIHLRTPDYELVGTVIQTDIPRLPTTQTDVVLGLTLPTETATKLTVGDTYEVGGQPIATIESIDAYRTGNPDRTRLLVGLTYRMYRPRDQPQFAGQIVREGTTLPFRTSDYAFTGDVVRMNAIEPRGRPTARTVRLELENIDPDLASSLRAGMTERVRGTTIAELRSVTVEPAALVLTSDGGNVFLRNHPINKDVTITADLQVRETVSGVRFKGATIHQGDQIVLDLGTLTIRATVTSI